MNLGSNNADISHKTVNHPNYTLFDGLASNTRGYFASVKYLRVAKYLRATSQMSIRTILKLSNEGFINPYIFLSSILSSCFRKIQMVIPEHRTDRIMRASKKKAIKRNHACK